VLPNSVQEGESPVDVGLGVREKGVRGEESKTAGLRIHTTQVFGIGEALNNQCRKPDCKPSNRSLPIPVLQAQFRMRPIRQAVSIVRIAFLPYRSVRLEEQA
jgi:hypothetical protein